MIIGEMEAGTVRISRTMQVEWCFEAIKTYKTMLYTVHTQPPSTLCSPLRCVAFVSNYSDNEIVFLQNATTDLHCALFF